MDPPPIRPLHASPSRPATKLPRARSVGEASRLFAAFTALLLTHPSCASAGLPTPAAAERRRLDALRSELQESRERWRREGASDYELTLQRICFCPDELTQPVVVTVRDGRIVAVRVAATGRPVDPEYAPVYPDVAGLFWIVEDAIDGEAASIDVEYDPGRGFPVRVDLDYDRGAYDDEMLFAVHGFAERGIGTGP
jgi:hypothetical protein